MTVSIVMVFAASVSQAKDSVIIPPSASPTAALSVAKKQTPRVAAGHILVQIAPNAEESAFLKHARGLGLHKLRRVRGTDWLVMGIGTAMGPRAAASAAKGLPGVVRASADPIVSINDQIPPRDPYYVDDPDPGTDCDIVEDPACQAEDLVDQWGLFKVMAENAWTAHTGSVQTVIAVVDSGVDFDHDDLWANIWTNPGEIEGNGVDDDGNGFVDDYHGWDFSGDNVGSPSDNPASEDNDPDIVSGGQWLYDPTAIPLYYRFDGDPAVGDGIDNNLEYYPLFFTMDIGVFHGTTVAGVVAAMTDNLNPATGSYEGFAGTCWYCALMPLRIINAEGEAFGSDAAEAIIYAADNGARIINASWGISPGGASQDELAILEQAIQYADSRGVILVAAAGNSGAQGLHFPASMPETIAVGSSNWLDVRSDFSSYADPANQEILDVVAPGEAIWNAGVLSAYDAWSLNGWLLFPELDYEPNRPGDDVYLGADGTSFAAPLVSGYLGLILSRNPCATSDQVKTILRDNAVDIDGPGYDVFTGFGRVAMVVPDLGCSTGGNQPPVAGFTHITSDLAVDFTDQSSDADGSVVSWSWNFGDAATSVEQHPSHTYAAGGTYTVTLTVTDDAGETDSAANEVTVSAGTATNTPPAAAFSYSCSGKLCDFSGDASTDDTGIATYTWDFGDGSPVGTGMQPTHTYSSPGSYSVTLTVADAEGATDSASAAVRVKNKGNTSGSTGGDGGDSTTTTQAEKGKKRCGDGLDNDGDGLIDGADPDCR
jgi:PKD repeat protein